MKSHILIILATISGAWGGSPRVYLDRGLCALTGASAVIKCRYYNFEDTVTGVSWRKFQQKDVFRRFDSLLISEDPSQHYYISNYIGDCSLQINDVQHADAGIYAVSFRTKFEQLTSKTSTNFSVKELTAAVQPSSVAEGDVFRLTCVPGCAEPVDVDWFKDEQPIRSADFVARREDTGWYHCAVRGQEKIRSAPVAVNVLYPPDRVTLTISPPGNVVRGSSVVLTCHSDASPPVRNNGYGLYREGRLIELGQNFTIPDVQPHHGGRYHCQAWNNISSRGVDHFNSSVVRLQVYYVPQNISITINPARVVWGSRVNLTCSSDANPPADTYIWYRNTKSSGSRGPQVGSGQVLSISSMEALHSGLYLCQARNQLGEKNSTEVLLAMVDEEHWGSKMLPAVAGMGLALIVTLVVALFLFWRWKKRHLHQKELDESNVIYSNIYGPGSAPPDAARHAIPSSSSQSRASNGSEVTYSTVNIKSRDVGGLSDSPDVQGSRSRGINSIDSVIYATISP